MNVFISLFTYRAYIIEGGRSQQPAKITAWWYTVQQLLEAASS
jgi:uroporphyrinogen-III decarboxylase